MYSTPKPDLIPNHNLIPDLNKGRQGDNITHLEEIPTISKTHICYKTSQKHFIFWIIVDLEVLCRYIFFCFHITQCSVVKNHQSYNFHCSTAGFRGAPALHGTPTWNGKLYLELPIPLFIWIHLHVTLGL